MYVGYPRKRNRLREAPLAGETTPRAARDCPARRHKFISILVSADCKFVSAVPLHVGNFTQPSIWILLCRECHSIEPMFVRHSIAIVTNFTGVSRIEAVRRLNFRQTPAAGMREEHILRKPSQRKVIFRNEGGCGPCADLRPAALGAAHHALSEVPAFLTHVTLQ